MRDTLNDYGDPLLKQANRGLWARMTIVARRAVDERMKRGTRFSISELIQIDREVGRAHEILDEIENGKAA